MKDVCIIGSGFAGTFLGLRLVERGLTVVLLEAGPRLSAADPPGGRLDLFPHRAVGDAVPALDANRTIGLGGTSRQWNGVVTRMLPTDFQSRSRFGFGVDWPIGYADLEPYYEQAEAAVSAHGAAPVPDLEPPRRRPYPGLWPPGVPAAPALARALGSFPLAFGTRAGAPLRLVDVELPRLASRATLVVDRPATRLICDDGHTISGVETRRPDGAVERFAARHVVVAAGVLETTRLLLASTAPDWPAGLGQRHDRLGRHLNGHPRYRRETVRAAADAAATGVHRSYAHADAFRREGLGAAAVDLNFGGPRPAVDVTLELEAAPGNQVSLDGDRRDAWGRPEAVVTGAWTERDQRTRSRARDLLADLATRAVGPGTAPGDERLTWFHPAGTCRMAARPEDGVVDADGRVFGLDNLYVAGASVFPTSGPTNPTLTVIALALRLGDHLAARR